MKGALKAKTVDKYLSPIRQQIKELVHENATVLEIGSGTGDLLIQLAPQIKTGVGLDISDELIRYAQQKVNQEGIDNLVFHKEDVADSSLPDQQFDYAIASLVLHVLPWEKANEVVLKLIRHSNHLILVGFIRPESLKNRFLLWLDQRFNKHYPNFKHYLQEGGIDEMLKHNGVNKFEKLDTFDATIKIYVLSTSSKS